METMTQTTNDYFGECPECKRTDGFLNIGRVHWFVCNEHKTKWCVGENLFSNWINEEEERWEKNRLLLLDYRKVEL
jgi:hypothetical protein